MPTNLPPEYFEADKRYREAESVAEKIACLEELISTVPKHKGTDHLRADLRRQLSKLKAEAQSQKRHGGHHSAFRIEREGAGQVVVIGPTNVGKSALIVALTNAAPEVSEAPYTTWRPTPGMMQVDNAQVQLVDTPPIDRDYIEPALIDLIRHSDLIFLVVDLQTNPIEQLEGAISLLREHHIAPDHLKGCSPEEERLIFKPLLVLVNKCDDESTDEDFEICCELLEEDWPLLPVSAATGRNLDRLRQMIFDRLGVIRVYTQAPGREADLSKPFVLKRGSTVAELANKIHKDFHDKMKSARVWGSTAFEGQMVQRDYVLQEGDVVEFRI